MWIPVRAFSAAFRFGRELFMLSVLLLLLGGCAGGKPEIAVAPERYDFGRITQGDVVTTAMTVRNTGKKELTIESVATSCGCTTAQVQPNIIPAGGEGKLLIRYDSGAHPDKGPIERHIYVASNDPEKAEMDIVITANVQPPT